VEGGTREPAAYGTHDHELSAVAVELERYWAEQWRRAKEICDLLERRLAARAVPQRPELRLVGSPTGTETTASESPRPDLRLV
jgi:hypothetical protein